jgi:rhamnulokinase
MSNQVFLAADLGASSGRVVAGLFDGSRLRLEEVHRFDNGPVRVGPHLHWDVLALWKELSSGLRAAASKYGERIATVGVDTWGVDFALLGRGDVVLGNPHHYRDSRTDGLMEKAFTVVPREEIFAQTGLQFMQFNTLYQLLAMRLANSPLLEVAESFLMMPDLFHWLLTGKKGNEFTNATTTQFYNPLTGGWATPLLERLGIPTHILGDIVAPGTDLGPLLPHVAAETGLKSVKVIAPGTHDTASAVMAVPAAAASGGRQPPDSSRQRQPYQGANAPRSPNIDAPRSPPNWCYISSGTWALMGVESPQPVINDACRRLNFTNEGGVGGTTRLLKNITGLWLLQECRRVWNQAGKNYSWDDLNRLSDAAPPLTSLVNPDDPAFMAPPDMPAAVRDACRASGEHIPDSEGAVIRCALESMALKCRQVLTWLEQLVGRRIETIHIVGGGTQNRRLCQATADATGRVVVAGPVEATAIGNLMMQAVAAGAVGSISQAREVIRQSFDVETYQPKNTAAWDEALGRFQRLSPEPS